MTDREEAGRGVGSGVYLQVPTGVDVLFVAFDLRLNEAAASSRLRVSP